MNFPVTVELWRPLVQRYAGDIPVDFLLAWIQKESNGNSCSWTKLREAGIFQLMAGDNQRDGGTTEAALRAGCVGTTQQLSRSLSDAEANEQVRSGVQYVRFARDQTRKKLAAVGAKWDESASDFWRLVKWHHVAPAYTSRWLTAAASELGRPPANWAEFRRMATGVPSSWLDNAEWVGGFGKGTIPVVSLVLVGGAALLYVLWRKRRR